MASLVSGKRKPVPASECRIGPPMERHEGRYGGDDEVYHGHAVRGSLRIFRPRRLMLRRSHRLPSAQHPHDQLCKYLLHFGVEHCNPLVSCAPRCGLSVIVHILRQKDVPKNCETKCFLCHKPTSFVVDRKAGIIEQVAKQFIHCFVVSFVYVVDRQDHQIRAPAFPTLCF